MEPIDKCDNCLHCGVYSAVNANNSDLCLCFADVEQDDDGLWYIPEISVFDSSDCVYFKEK